MTCLLIDLVDSFLKSETKLTKKLNLKDNLYYILFLNCYF